MTAGPARPISTEMTIDSEGDQTYVSKYDVFVTDPMETTDNVSTTTGMPLFGDSYTWGAGGNVNAFCSGKHVSPVETDGTHLKRTVTATFTTKSGHRARSGNNLVQHPVNEPWRITGSFVNGTRVTSIDKDGDAITNSAKQQKWLDVPDGYDTLNLSGPSTTISLPTRAQAIRKCNSDTIWGLTLRQLFLAQWDYDIRYHGDDDYVYHHLEFHINYDQWNEVWLDAGTKELIDGVQYPFLPANDSLSNDERFLDGAGREVLPSNIPAGCFTFTTKVIKEFDFRTLGFPDPLPGPFV